MNEENSIKFLNHMLVVCFSDEKVQELRDFIADKAEYFETITSDEYDSIHQEIYMQFLELVEVSIDTECEKMGTSKEDMFRLCKHYEDVPSVDVFNTIITLTTTPEAFFDMMRDPAKQNFVFGTIRTWQSYFSKK